VDAEELRNMLPEGKHDVKRARALVKLGYPAVSPVLPEILQWMQDYNWPVAHVIFPFLVSIGEPLAPYVRDVLATDDTMWKVWFIHIVGASPPLADALHTEIRKMAAMIPKDEDEEWLLEEVHRLFPNVLDK